MGVPLTNPPSSVSSLFQWLPEIRVGQNQRFGNAMTNCTGLARYPAAEDTNLDIEVAMGVGYLKRVQHLRLQSFHTKKIVRRAVVNRNLPFARCQPGSGYGCLSFASCVKYVFCSHRIPRF